MKPGDKLALYINRAVAADLALLRECYPNKSATELVRRALSRYAAEAFEQAESREVQEAYGLWN